MVNYAPQFTSIEKETVEVFPNPTSGPLFIRTRLKKAKRSIVSLYSTSGTNLYTYNHIFNEGVDKLEINLNSVNSDLKSGFYIITINLDGELFNYKILYKK